MTEKHDPVHHPRHYTTHPSGVECIDIAEHLSFNLGNALKYVWRAGLKGNALEDLQKAKWYVERESMRIELYELQNPMLKTDVIWRAFARKVIVVEPAKSALAEFLRALLAEDLGKMRGILRHANEAGENEVTS